MSDSSDSLPPYPGLTAPTPSGYPAGGYPPPYVGPAYPGGGGGYQPPPGYGPGFVPTSASEAGGAGGPGGPWAPPPGAAGAPAPRRRWLGPALGGVAVVLAAGAFLLGRGTAHSAPSTSTISTATALSALSSATTPPANAACAGPRDGAGAGGTLKSVSGSTLTVTGKSGASKTVKTDSNTKITKVVKGSPGDVKAGAVVTVHGTASGTTGIAADQVAILPSGTTLPGKTPPTGTFGPKAQTAGIAIGTVQNVTGTSFTVSSGGATITVTTSGSTVFSKTVTTTVGQLTVGQPISVRGTPNSDGSITATQIIQADPGVAGGKVPGFGFGPGPRGRGPGSP